MDFPKISWIKVLGLGLVCAVGAEARADSYIEAYINAVHQYRESMKGKGASPADQRRAYIKHFAEVHKIDEADRRQGENDVKAFLDKVNKGLKLPAPGKLGEEKPALAAAKAAPAKEAKKPTGRQLANEGPSARNVDRGPVEAGGADHVSFGGGAAKAANPAGQAGGADNVDF